MNFQATVRNKPPAPKENIKHLICHIFFLLFIFAALGPDPQTQMTPDPIRIRIWNTVFFPYLAL
jgi:hypothetical protein